MSRLRTAPKAIAAGSGVLAMCLTSVAPAFSYPLGTQLAIRCDRFTYSPGETAICVLSNINPAGPDDIVLGDRIGAQGDEIRIELASFAAQDAGGTYTENLVLPQTTGLYAVIGTSADETATTNVRVVAAGVPTAFSVTVNANGTITVQNAQPGCQVTIYANGTPVATVTIGPDGTGTATPTAPIPPNATLTAKQTGSDTCSVLESEPVVLEGEFPSGGGSGGSGSGSGGSSGGGSAGTDADALEKAGADANVALGFVAGLAALGVGGGLVASSRRKKP